MTFYKKKTNRRVRNVYDCLVGIPAEAGSLVLGDARRLLSCPLRASLCQRDNLSPQRWQEYSTTLLLTTPFSSVYVPFYLLRSSSPISYVRACCCAPFHGSVRNAGHPLLSLGASMNVREIDVKEGQAIRNPLNTQGISSFPKERV